MKTNYKIILYLLPIVLLFTTCRKNTTKPADQHFYYYLTKEQISKTPYFTNPAFDTLTYISNQNDTLIFAKTKTDTLWYISSVFDPGGTADKYYHYQQLRNSYATLKGEGKFEVLQHYNFKTKYGNVGNATEVSFKDKFIFDYDLKNLDTVKYKDTYYLSKVEVNSKTYWNVILISGNEFTFYKGYINSSYGVFMIKDSFTNDFWYLNK